MVNFLRRMITRMHFNRKYGIHPGVLRIAVDGLALFRYSFADGVVTQESAWKFRWHEVQRITGFKRDCITVDLICLAFTLNDRSVEINEEMEGYEALTAALPEHFPGMAPQWWKTAAFPPFAPNVTVIWPSPMSTQFR